MYRVNFKISRQNIPCAAYGKFNHIFIITKNPSTALLEFVRVWANVTTLSKLFWKIRDRLNGTQTLKVYYVATKK